MQLPDFEAWAMFASVVEHRSFSGAAEAIGVSKATVSKAVSRLERSLGVSLFHRTSRKLTLTDSGSRLADHAGRILTEAQAAEESARDAAAAPSGLVRVAAPLTFGLNHVAPALADFMTLHQTISIDLRLTDARVDIVAEGFDLALRIADLPDSSLRARRLAPVRVRLVAAPAYLDRRGRPRHPADLIDHDVFQYANVIGALHLRGPEGATYAVKPAGRFTSDNSEAMLPLLRAGLGMAWLPDFIVDTEIAAGRLEALMPDWHGPAIALHLVTPPGALRPARVEALIAYLAERFRESCTDRS